MLRNAVKKYKNDIYNSWSRLKRFGVTGFLRLILSAAGGLFLSALITSTGLNLVYDKPEFVLLTDNFLWEEIGFLIVWLQIFVILFLALSAAEQGIRALLKINNTDNFAADSFAILFDGDTKTDYENRKAEESFESLVDDSPESHEKEIERRLSGEKNDFSFGKAVAIIAVVFILLNGINFYIYTTGRTAVYDTCITKTSFFNPWGDTYTYDHIKEYVVDINDDFPQLTLVTDTGKSFQLSSNGICQTDDAIKSGESAIVELDKILKEQKVKKTINCSIFDFSELYIDVEEIKPLFN